MGRDGMKIYECDVDKNFYSDGQAVELVALSVV